MHDLIIFNTYLYITEYFKYYKLKVKVVCVSLIVLIPTVYYFDGVEGKRAGH